MRSLFRWALVFVVLRVSVVNARPCTPTELTQLSGVAETFTSSPDCAGSALGTSGFEICAGPCTKLIRMLQPLTPDCENDGANLGETMQAIEALCDSASTSSSGSSSTAGSTWMVSNLTTTDAVPTCTTENITLINDLYDEATRSVDCQGSGGTAAGTTGFCARAACVSYMTDVETRVPNCTYGGYNLKQEVADTLAICNDSSVTWPPTSTPSATLATTTITPTMTSQTPSAASSQATDAPAVIKSAANTLAFETSISFLVLALASNGLLS